MKHRTILSGLALITGLASISAPAGAEIRHIEFQLSAEKLVELVKHLAMSEAETICAGLIPFLGNEYVLDHIDFSDPGFIKWEEVKTPWPPYNSNTPTISAGPYMINRVQLVVPVRLFLKWPQCVTDPNCFDYALPSPPRVDLFFNLSTRGSQLCFRFSKAEVLGAPIEDGGKLNAIKKSLCRTLNLGPIKKYIGDSTITNTGLSADEGLTRIAFRIELDGPVWKYGSPPFGDPDDTPPDPAWIDFFNGQIGPGMAQLPSEYVDGMASPWDWSVYLDHELFTAEIVRSFADSLDKCEDGKDVKFCLETGPTGVWTSLGNSGGHVDLTFTGEVDISDKFPICLVDTIEVDATVLMDLYVDGSAPNLVQSHATLETDLVDSDVLACVGVLGLAPEIVSLVGVIASTIDPDESDLTVPWFCTALSGTEFTCSRSVNVPPVKVGDGVGQSGELTIGKMVGTDAGPVLGGTCEIQPRPYALLTAQSGGFKYGVHGGCSDNTLGAGPWPWIGYYCTVRVAGSGILCKDIEIVDDPLNMFGMVGEPTGGERLMKCCPNYGKTFQIKFPLVANDPRVGDDPYDQYFNPNSEYYRYPCRLRIRSSVGSRTFEIPPPVKGDPEPFKQELFLKQVDCIPPGTVSPLGIFDPIWHIDPAPLVVDMRVQSLDPLIGVQTVIGHVTNLQLIPNGPLAGADATVGMHDIRGASVDIQGTVETDLCAIVPCGGGSSVNKGATTKQTNASHASQILSVPFAATVRSDLTASVLDGALTTSLAFAQVISETVELPSDQLPAGIEGTSFHLTLDPAEMSFLGTLTPSMLASGAADEPAAAADPPPVPTPGMCGTGIGGTMAFTLVGLAFAQIGMSAPRRRKA